MKTFLLIVMGLIVVAEHATAQRLVIDSPSDGPFTRVVYGHVDEKVVSIFESDFPLLPDESAELQTQNFETSDEAAPKQSAQTSEIQEKKTTLATFTLPSGEEIKQCTSSARYKGFLTLVDLLKSKIKDVEIAADSDADECAQRILGTLNKILTQSTITLTSNTTEGIRVVMGVFPQAPPAKPIPVVKDDKKLTTKRMDFAEAVKHAQVFLGELKATVNKEHYFVFEVATLSEQEVTVKIPGYQVVTTKIFPVTISAESTVVARGMGYTARIANFKQPTLAISVGEIPFLTKKTTIDGGLGGGIGYGREVPGEVRGQRLVSLLGVERRNLYKDIGVKGSLFYTRASSTVVPQTFTFRGLGFYDWDFFDQQLYLRLGGGYELFNAQITYSPTVKTQVLIPQQVTAPLAAFSIHGLLFNRVTVATALIVSPLFVGSSYYPSYSPSIELGVKVWKDWMVLAQYGSEAHRFPSVIGDTKLELDYLVFTAKRGLF